MKCPFCNQKDLVFIPEKYRYIAPEEILSYLNQRSGLLDGVVISGGEPLLQEELIYSKGAVGYFVNDIDLDTILSIKKESI